MDEAFKKASEQLKAHYDKAFWEEAKAKLDDASLDQAFRNAANSAPIATAIAPKETVDDIFMDATFVDASAQTSVQYDSSFFKDFKEKEEQLEMDVAFQEAAAAIQADYAPEYWSAADEALQNEGLHYEYRSAYWDEAKKLLDQSDRKTFFIKWSGAAAILLLISFLAPFNTNQTREMAGIIQNSDNIPSHHTIRFNQKDLLPSTELIDITESITREENTARFNEQDNNELSLIQNNQKDFNLATVNSGPLSEIDLTNASNKNNFNVDTKEDPIRSNEELMITPLMNDISTTSTPEETNEMRSFIDRVNLQSKQGLPPAPELELNPNNKPKGVHAIAILASAGIGNKWASPQLIPTLRSSFGAEYLFSPTGGLRNFEFGASATLNHNRQSGLGVEKRTHVYDINGGVTKYWYKLQISDVITTNLNFITNFRISPRHKLRFGCGVEWLTAAKSNMSYQSPIYGGIQTVNDNWGVKDGLNAFDYRLSAGYDFQLSNNLTVQLSGNLGLLDRTNNEFLKSDIYDREMNLMLGLKYNIFRKI